MSLLLLWVLLMFAPVSCGNTESIRDYFYWTCKKNSLELIELSGMNKVSLV